MTHLFLSHAGSDVALAADPKMRLLATAGAEAADLAVWLDCDDLDIGRPWQPQIEAAIQDARRDHEPHRA